MMSRFAAVALCLSLGACNMYSTPGTTASAFDGTYSGTMNPVNAVPNGCPTMSSSPGSLAVQNGSVSWPSTPSLTLYAPVAPDGSFVAQNGTIFLSGKITNRAMVARANTGSCHILYDLTKST